MGSVERALKMVPEFVVETINSSCCGMAGAFGYDIENIEISNRMGELSLLPKVRDANDECLIIADGTSCRHQIANGTNRRAEHVACVLERALPKVEG
jgi:Fe-S oxidoreductase